MLEKIKIKEVSSHLGATNKTIVDLLSRYFKGTRNLNSVLQEAELDVILEHFTRAKAVESFDEYFALGLSQQQPKPAKAAPEKAETKAAQDPAKTAEGKEKTAEGKEKTQRPEKKADKEKEPPKPAQARP
ncbi:MAG: hypothetical protein FWH26_01150, partial [Oscillospiraceae bacterium]|nr:hypothetical protein [Oscillospiraceae bacterium]